MGARQSKRSVDITTTPKKEGLPAEAGAAGEAVEKIEKLGIIEEVVAADANAKPTSNGVAPHTEKADDKEKDKDEATEKDKDNETADACNVKKSASSRVHRKRSGHSDQSASAEKIRAGQKTLHQRTETLPRKNLWQRLPASLKRKSHTQNLRRITLIKYQKWVEKKELSVANVF
ncbi:unnamed protein product [Trichogramma brassicae]|uniref:Uncharacterized protein n=1 Tax=Trichogramma brassicae TaxID=86971 RepID=A0A6H5HZQ0_9HYME|nr:unnamed protein product [Trichogramma brassicae]